MTYAKTRAIRLTDDQVASLEALATELQVSGKGGARLNPVIARIADIAAECAASGDWGRFSKLTQPLAPAVTGKGL